MSDRWTSDIKLEDKLFTPIIRDIFAELGTNQKIQSMVEFHHKSQRSYSQIHKVRNYLMVKGIIEIVKEGKDTKMILTEKGKTVIEGFMQFLNTLRMNEQVR